MACQDHLFWIGDEQDVGCSVIFGAGVETFSSNVAQGKVGPEELGGAQHLPKSIQKNRTKYQLFWKDKINLKFVRMMWPSVYIISFSF